MYTCQIHVVYFVWTQSEGPLQENYRPIIQRNLDALLTNGICGAASASSQFQCQIHPVVSATSAEKRGHVMGHLREIIQSYVSDIPIEFTEGDGTGYEWPGINRVWEIGQNSRDQDLILYFHDKGVTHENYGRYINFLETTLLKQAPQIANKFQNDKTILKLGFQAGSSGFLFYNWWWARVCIVHMYRNYHCYM